MLPNRNPLHNRYDPVKDLPELDGKIIFVTGGTAGIGRLTVVHLARHNPEHIYFTGRNVEQAQSLIEELKSSASKTKVTFIKCDFASLASVKSAVAKHPISHLDILICNAGVMVLPTGLSKDNYEIQFAINHIAHALIIKMLFPSLQAAAASTTTSDVRIIIAASVGFRYTRQFGIAYDTLNTTQSAFMGPAKRYCQSKYANVLYAYQLAKLHPDITSVSQHPGVVDTDMVRKARWLDRFVIWSTNLGRKYFSAEEGALNQLWLAAGMKKESIKNGMIYLPVGIEKDNLDDLDREAKQLWEWTEKELGKVL